MPQKPKTAKTKRLKQEDLIESMVRIEVENRTARKAAAKKARVKLGKELKEEVRRLSAFGLADTKSVRVNLGHEAMEYKGGIGIPTGKITGVHVIISLDQSLSPDLADRLLKFARIERDAELHISESSIRHEIKRKLQIQAKNESVEAILSNPEAKEAVSKALATLNLK